MFFRRKKKRTTRYAKVKRVMINLSKEDLRVLKWLCRTFGESQSHVVTRSLITLLYCSRDKEVCDIFKKEMDRRERHDDTRAVKKAKELLGLA